MDDVRGLFLGMPHGTTPAAVTTNKNIIMSSFKSSGDIQTMRNEHCIMEYCFFAEDLILRASEHFRSFFELSGLI